MQSNGDNNTAPLLDHGGDQAGHSSSSWIFAISNPTPTTTPQTMQPRPEETLALVATELNQLSLEERERVQEEIHGVASLVAEDKQLVSRRLIQLNIEIGYIRKRSAYERALFLSPGLVLDEDFRLMFLRADNFDPRKAAQRMVNFFEFKLDLFGAEKLCKQITLEDLSEDDIAALYSGACQVLQEKDRTGRKIICSCAKYRNHKSPLNGVRDDSIYKSAQHSTECTLCNHGSNSIFLFFLLVASAFLSSHGCT